MGVNPASCYCKIKNKRMQSQCPHSKMRPLLGQASAQLFSPPARVAPATLVHQGEHVMINHEKRIRRVWDNHAEISYPASCYCKNKNKRMQSPCPHSKMRPLLGQASAQLFSPPARVAPATLVHQEEHVMINHEKRIRRVWDNHAEISYLLRTPMSRSMSWGAYITQKHALPNNAMRISKMKGRFALQLHHFVEEHQILIYQEPVPFLIMHMYTYPGNIF